MILPVPCSRNLGTTALEQRNAPIKLVPMTRSQSSSLISSTGLVGKIPALLTKISTLRNSFKDLSIIAWTDSSSETSVHMAKALPPETSISFFTLFAHSSFTSAMTTLAPSRAKPSAIALPIPCPAPVTMAIRCSSRFIYLTNRNRLPTGFAYGRSVECPSSAESWSAILLTVFPVFSIPIALIRSAGPMMARLP